MFQRIDRCDVGHGCAIANDHAGADATDRNAGLGRDLAILRGPVDCFRWRDEHVVGLAGSQTCGDLRRSIEVDREDVPRFALDRLRERQQARPDCTRAHDFDIRSQDRRVQEWRNQ